MVAEKDNPVIVGDEGREVWLRGEGKRIGIISPLLLKCGKGVRYDQISADFSSIYIYKEKEGKVGFGSLDNVHHQ